MIFRIAKLGLLLFVSSSLSITLTALMSFANVNYGNILYFSGLTWILVMVFLMKTKLDLKLLSLIFFAINSIFLVSITIAKFQVIHEILKNSSTNEGFIFFAYFIPLFFLISICGFIVLRRLSIDKK
jgi:hypothetical protein